MSERPDFLKQTAKQRAEDRDLQKKLKAEAAARGNIPHKQERRQDFLERSIRENRRMMRGADKETKKQLKARNKFLRGELKRGSQ